MSTHSPYLEISNEGERRGIKGNISLSFPLIPLILFTLKMRRKGGNEKIFNRSPFTSPPSPLVIYLNEMSIDHIPFLSFPSLPPLYFNPNIV